jgi:SPP1 family phage portal protein
MEDLKKYKAIKVDDEGGVDTIKAEIPVEAVKEFITELKSLIVMMGQGIDPAPDKIGSGISGVALEFLYGLLDLKCSNMESEFVPALRELLWFVNKYNEMTHGPIFNPDDIQVTLKRNKIRSDADTVNICKQSQGIISDKTIVSNHPWVKNPDDEIAAVKAQKAEELAQYSDPVIPKKKVGDGSGNQQ